ncbi:hypothetical protein [Ramlibacter sp. AN1133]|uniref:hypothetical protein n=1 Tax=Ramlibacter sp. AN1133 TaxID=3133429 RepID=UPI0030C0D484
MVRAAHAFLLAACCFAAGASAQVPTAAQANPEELRRACAALPATPTDALETARRAECLLAGLVPSDKPLEEARALARAALAKGEPAGGLLLYMAFRADPATQVLREGKVDPEAYRRFAGRPLAQRREEIEAIEGLGFAAGRNNRAAGALLAAYFHDTLAPGNVTRLGALTALLARNGDHGDTIRRFAREAEAIERQGSGTKASASAFLTIYNHAAAAAKAGYREQTGGRTCDEARLKSVSAGEVEGAEFLPLTGNLVAQSYLVRGHWSEFWRFQACGQEVPVKVTFEADGGGGSNSRAIHNKGA